MTSCFAADNILFCSVQDMGKESVTGPEDFKFQFLVEVQGKQWTFFAANAKE